MHNGPLILELKSEHNSQVCVYIIK